MVPKRVCILKHRFNKSGGLEKSTRAIAYAFAKKGCQVVIISSDLLDTTLFTTPQITSVQLPVKSNIGLLRIKEFDQKVKQYLKTESFDLVFGMDRNQHQTHLRLGNGIHKVFLVRRAPVESFLKKLSFKINPLHRLIIGYEKTALESSCLKCLFTNSNMVKQELLEHYSTLPSKVHVVHNGVEWKAMENDFSCWVEKKPKIAKELGLNPLDIHLLFIGHGFKRKGLGLLLDALRHVKDKQFHLSILGTDKHLKKYEKLCADYDLQGKVTFYGECTDTRKFYQLCDIVVIPSLYDPFANVTVEALAMGLFTVSSAFNGGSEILQEGTGSIFPDLFSAKESAKCLDDAMQRHKKTWAKSIKIRDSVKHLDFSSQTATLVDISLNHC